MANVKLYGFDKLEKTIDHVSLAFLKIQGEAIYEGAKIVADAVKEEIRALPVDERNRPKDGLLHGVKKIQKIGLEKGLGIAPLQNDRGFENVKVGFDGYNMLKTKSNPKGQPNVKIARAVESGTSFSEKIPFVRNALKKSRNQAKKQMNKTFEVALEKLLK